MYKTIVPTLITNGHFNREITLKELKRIGADSVALAVERELQYRFSSPENLQLLRELIEYYQENGLAVLVWLGETFGHEGGKPEGDQPYANMRLIDEGDIKAFCPLDESFKQDICLWITKIAECGAKMILLDDDFRLGLRPGLGCCCDLHLMELKRELGEAISVEHLREKIFHGGGSRYRSAWMKVQRESMYCFANALRKAVDAVDPGIRLGMCCSLGSWDAEGIDVFQLAEILAGGTKPIIRTCGAPYWATQQPEYNRLGDVIEATRTQLAWCRTQEIDVITEGDTYPRPRFATPASYLECFDMILRSDGNAEGILKYAFDYISDADYETGYVDAAVRNQALYQWIGRNFKSGQCLGVRPYNVTHLLEHSQLDGEKPELWEKIQTRSVRYPSLRLAAANSLPISYEDGNVNIVFGENARYIPWQKLKDGAIVDLPAAKILMEREIDVGIQSILSRDAYVKPGFTAVPQEFFTEEKIYTRLSDGVEISKINHKNGAEILTEYHDPAGMEAGVFTYENADGMRFLVFPFDAEQARDHLGWLDSYARKRQLIKRIPWLQRRKMEVYVAGNYPYLYLMAKRDQEGITIGLWNLFEDEAVNVEVTVELPIKHVSYANCSGHQDGNRIVLDTSLYPFAFAGIRCDLEKPSAGKDEGKG